MCERERKKRERIGNLIGTCNESKPILNVNSSVQQLSFSPLISFRIFKVFLLYAYYLSF